MVKNQALPLSAFCCQNEQCAEYGKKGLGNIYFHCWNNQKQTIRKLRCRTCQTSFSERKGDGLVPVEVASGEGAGDQPTLGRSLR